MITPIKKYAGNNLSLFFLSLIIARGFLKFGLQSEGNMTSAIITSQISGKINSFTAENCINQ